MIHRMHHAWAVATLRRQLMPEAEIRELLAATDPEVVRRRLELHEERLEEILHEQRRALDSIRALYRPRDEAS
jgi:hypothetical protein